MSLVLEYRRSWNTQEEILTAYIRSQCKAIEVLLSDTMCPSHPTSIPQFLHQFELVHRETFEWLLKHAAPIPQGQMPDRITLQVLIATTQYLKGDQNV